MHRIDCARLAGKWSRHSSRLRMQRLAVESGFMVERDGCVYPRGEVEAFDRAVDQEHRNATERALAWLPSHEPWPVDKDAGSYDVSPEAMAGLFPPDLALVMPQSPIRARSRSPRSRRSASKPAARAESDDGPSPEPPAAIGARCQGPEGPAAGGGT